MANTMRGNKQSTEQIRLMAEQAGLRHIAFIMDGNGRWAAKRGLPREMGHKAGVEAFRRVIRYCGDVGFSAVTAYALSTENWKRPLHEVTSILSLLDTYIDEAERDREKNRIRYRFIGETTGLSEDLLVKMRRLEELTASYPLVLNIALNYGGRAEIVSAVNRLLAEGKTFISEEDLSAAVYTAPVGDPDLIVRTAGERRLSNFLLWQAAYAEYWFTERYWPDMNAAVINEAVIDFARRKRCYGGIDAR